jgi:ribonuclease R
MGTVATVVNFGLFIYIPSLMLEGLLHITKLDDDYFIFNEVKQLLIGKKTGITYKSGQEIFIEISGVDMAQLFIDFKLAKAD